MFGPNPNWRTWRRKVGSPCTLRLRRRDWASFNTFVGLLHLTWQTLDVRHSFIEKFGFDTSAFFADVLTKLNDTRSLADVLNCRVGAHGVKREAAL